VTLYAGGQKLVGGQAYDRALMSREELAAHEAEARQLISSGTRVSDFYPARQRREMLITIATPFAPAALSGDGFLAAEISLRRVQELLAGVRIGRRGLAFIVDERGRLVAHPSFDRVLQRENLSGVSVVAQLRDNIARAVATGRPVTVVTD